MIVLNAKDVDLDKAVSHLNNTAATADSLILP
jgi:hypothetical protein